MEVLWRWAIQLLVNCNGQLKFNLLLHWLPVKLPQDGFDVLTPSITSNKVFCIPVLSVQNTS